MSGDDGGISGIPNDSHLRDTTHEDSMSGWPSSNSSTTILYKLEGKNVRQKQSLSKYLSEGSHKNAKSKCRPQDNDVRYLHRS